MFLFSFSYAEKAVHIYSHKPPIALILNELAMRRRQSALFNGAKLVIICVKTKLLRKYFFHETARQQRNKKPLTKK